MSVERTEPKGDNNSFASASISIDSSGSDTSANSTKFVISIDDGPDESKGEVEVDSIDLYFSSLSLIKRN